MEDKDIIELFWRRDEAAIKETAEKYGTYCRKIAGNILFLEEDVEECINDTWLRTWNLIPPYEPSELKIFVGRIARGFAVNRCKSNLAQKRSDGQYTLVLEELEDTIVSKATAESESDSKLVAAAISDFLHQQPHHYAGIFVRRYFYLERVAAIADFYDISESKVKSVLFRMRKKLKKHLEKEALL